MARAKRGDSGRAERKRRSYRESFFLGEGGALRFISRGSRLVLRMESTQENALASPDHWNPHPPNMPCRSRVAQGHHHHGWNHRGKKNEEQGGGELKRLEIQRGRGQSLNGSQKNPRIGENVKSIQTALQCRAIMKREFMGDEFVQDQI